MHDNSYLKVSSAIATSSSAPPSCSGLSDAFQMSIVVMEFRIVQELKMKIQPYVQGQVSNQPLAALFSVHTFFYHFFNTKRKAKN